jgi:hypothetical protein
MRFALKHVLTLNEGLYSLYNLREQVNIERVIEQLHEKFAITDLGAHAVSGITNKALNTRIEEPYTNKEIFLRRALWDTTKDTLLFNFDVKPTFTSRTPAVMTTKGNRGARVFYNYTILLQYTNVSKFLGSPKQYALKVQAKIVAMKNLIFHGECRIHSNDPSFYYQGMWEDLAKVGATIYKFPGPNGQGIWRARHSASGGLAVPEIRITKHIAHVIQEIGDWVKDAVQYLEIK